MKNLKQKAKNNNLKLKIAFSLIVGFLLLIVGQINAQAAPEFLVSWQAVNYVPASYQGKILPSRSTPIEVSFDLIDNNKIVNLSNYEIRWFLDGELLNYSKGLKTIHFNSQGIDHKIRITVLDYKGAELNKIFTILGARPKVIINVRTPDNNIGLGMHVFEALPYFFNVSGLRNLSFSWSSNNQPITGLAANPQFFVLDLESSGSVPMATDLTIAILVHNIFNQSESSSKKINLKIR